MNPLEREELPEGRDGKSWRGRAPTVQVGVGLLLGSLPQIPARWGESSDTSPPPTPCFPAPAAGLGSHREG